MANNRLKGRDQRWQAQREIGAVTPGPPPPLHYPGRDILQTNLGQVDQHYDAKVYHELYVYDQWFEFRATVDNATPNVHKFPFPVKKITIKNLAGATANLFFNLNEGNIFNTLNVSGGTRVMVVENGIEREFKGLAGIKSITMLSDQAVAIQYRVTIWG